MLSPEPQPFHVPTETASPLPRARPTACFAVTIEASPGAVPRVIEPFARRSLVPTRWHGALGSEGEMQIDIQVADLGRAGAERIAVTLRALVGVRAVLTYDKTR